MEDVCLVCAEPLVYTAFGPCGHKDACSKCILRLRTVLKDTRCVTCRQTCESVYVTRAMGSYTPTLTTDQFSSLPSLMESKKVFLLAAAQAYFDDEQHYRQMKALCSFSHPSLTDSSARLIQCSSLQSLSSKIYTALGKRFCTLCLEGRKVFIGEQLLYTPHELEQHIRKGDDQGVLAESGFHGHPECRFCHQHFYGENELYMHMHTAHEQCFLCRRADPTQHVYYRNYADLENHFSQEHYPCQQPSCLEKKFVVFPTLQELRQHTVREHGDMLSKADKRAAMVLPVDFSFRQHGNFINSSTNNGSFDVDAPSSSSVTRHQQSGITIGGGAGGINSRFSRRSNSADELAAALQASLTTLSSSQSTPSAEESTSAADSRIRLDNESEFPSFGAPNVVGMTSNAGSTGRWAGTVGGSSGAGSLGPDQFPSLAPVSKAARRRQRQAERDLREEISMAQRLGARNAVRVINPGTINPGDNNNSSSAGQTAAFPALPPTAPRPSSSNSSRPALKSTARRELRVPEGQFREEDGWRVLSRDEQEAQLLAGLRASRLPRQPSSQALPSREEQTNSINAASSADCVAPTTLPTNSNAGVVEGKRAQRLRAANKALTSKIKGRLSAEDFDVFRVESAAWVKGDISTADYALTTVSLGLAELVPELAATCPDQERGNELLKAMAQAKKEHRRAQGSWVPPEVIEVERQSAVPPSVPQRQESPAVVGPTQDGDAAFPSLPTASSSRNGASSQSQASKVAQTKKGKGPKQSLATFFEQADKAPKKPPESAWDSDRNPVLRGQWKKAGPSLAEKERIMQDAWGSRR